MEQEEKKQEGMIIVRLYRTNPKTKKKEYISRIFTRNKRRTNHLQVNYTPHKEMAYVFKTMEEIVQFYDLIVKGNHGVNKDDLKLEREQVSKTFVEEFGEDPMPKEQRVEYMNFLAKKEYYESNIRARDITLKELSKIDKDELTKEAKEEVEDVMINLAKERDVFVVRLNKLLNDEDDSLGDETKGEA